MTRILISMLLAAVALCAPAQRQRILFDDNWLFAFGDASSPAKDFGCGTEYFNYLTKANSVHNEGPYSLKFDPAKWDKEWITVDLPHDWVVDLPFSGEASHSHGYKTVGYKYPETSVGWYRKTFTVPESDKGRRIGLTFDGIFRDARVWVNGFYLGNEPSGYAVQHYDITDYLNYGGDNLVTVRCDATLEEGWFYEGAGIYRHVWLDKTHPVHISINPNGIYTYTTSDDGVYSLHYRADVANDIATPACYSLGIHLIDADGNVVATDTVHNHAAALDKGVTEGSFRLDNPHLWDTENPYLYTLRAEVFVDGDAVDAIDTKVGVRTVDFDADRGFLLNGQPLKIKGANMHQDHAGVGAGIPDALQLYRMRTLKDWGFNAVRASHNPSSEALLNVCDSLGILFLEENRLSGINDYHIGELQRMINEHANHPSIILWSVGNEEWGIEWNEYGDRISRTMTDWCHKFDPSRKVTFASSSGPTVLVPTDVAGYNYIMQHPVEQHRANYPERCAVGTEETTGSGTRGVYYTDSLAGRMRALNLDPDEKDGTLNRIERGWKFYDERPWLGGLFYWTGFDYRGESNPMVWPATGSEFGIFDYCGFPKDEAYYLKSWWTDEPVLHILPHWNLKGHKGEPVSVWVYSNCDEVELTVNGRKLGRKQMPHNGHLEWETVYTPGKIKAIGYRGGKKVMEKVVETTDTPSKATIAADRSTIKADGRDLAVCGITLYDKKGRFVPDAETPLTITVEGPVRILGAGNGDPGFKAVERPVDRDARTFDIDAFSGMAQVLIQSNGTPGTATVTVTGPGLKPATLTLSAE